MEGENGENLWSRWATYTFRRALDQRKMIRKAVWYLIVQLPFGGAEGSSSSQIFSWLNSRLSTVPLVGYKKAVPCQHLCTWRWIGVFPNISWRPPPGSPGCLCPFPVSALWAALPSFPWYVPRQRESGKTEALKAVSQPAGVEALANSGSLNEGELAKED